MGKAAEARTVKAWQERNERVAGKIMSTHLGAEVREIDPGGGPQQLHDLEIDLPDGTIWAVEVTQHTDSAVTRTLAEIQKRTWEFAGLERGWFVHHIGVMSVAALHRELPSLLGDLESLGVTKWMVASSSHVPDDEPYASLHRLGVRMVISPEIDMPGQVTLGRAAHGGWVDANALNEAATALANLADNSSKLAAAAAHRRVLFVWVDSMNTSAGIAIDADELPTGPPEAPDHVDEIWMVAAYDLPRIVVWNRERGWHHLARLRSEDP